MGFNFSQFDLSPGVAERLDRLYSSPDQNMSYPGEVPPPDDGARPLGLASGAPDVAAIPNASGPAPVENASSGLNWGRAGERVRSAAEAVQSGVNFLVPGAGIGQAIGKVAGNAITAKPGPGSEDTGEGVTPEMIENRQQVASGRPAGAQAESQVGAGQEQAVSRGSPGYYVGARWVPTTESTTVQHGIDESHLAPGQKLRQEGLQHGEAALEQTRQAAAKEAAADVAFAETHRQLTADANARMRAIENEKQAYLVREHEKLDSLNVAAQAQVDPEAAKGPAGAQVFAAMGIALGQFGASLNGGTNTALQIVNANIDRRIRAQESNIANAHKSLDNEQNLYRNNLAAFGDKERAALATKMQYIDQAKAILDQQYAAAKSNRNEAQYHAMSEGLDEKYAQYADQFGIRTADQIATTGSRRFAPAHMEGVGAGAGKPLSNLVTVGKTTFQMPNEKQADKSIEKIQIINQLQRMNNRALVLRGELRNLNSGTDREEYNKRFEELADMEGRKVNLLSSEDGQGVVKENEFARAMDSQAFFTKGYGEIDTLKGVGAALNPSKDTTRNVADDNIRRQIKRGEEDARNFVVSAGGRVVQQGYAHDASGNLAPVARYTGQDAAAVQQLPPDGFRPMRAGQGAPTAGRPLSETIEPAPIFDDQQPAPAAGGKGGKGPTVKRHK